jgi:hypothetical protein
MSMLYFHVYFRFSRRSFFGFPLASAKALKKRRRPPLPEALLIGQTVAQPIKSLYF